MSTISQQTKYMSWSDKASQTVDLSKSTLDCFLQAIERRALRMAEFATRNREEALDLVQEAMYRFVRHYATKDEADWPPLFYKILDSQITDWHRRNKVRNRWLFYFAFSGDDEVDPIVLTQSEQDLSPLAKLMESDALNVLQTALTDLPLRQRQAFLLRIWEGMSVAQTASSMRCSEGSVKTHLFRALSQLRRALEDHL